MKTRIVPFLLVIMLISTTIGYCQKNEKNAIQESEKSANRWLNLVDQEQYGKSWDEAASMFQAAVTKEKWIQSLKVVRTPLGKLITRKRKSTQYTTTLPGAPDGEYVVYQFHTVFQNKKSVTETVTLMLEKDGKWKVVGYFIQR